MRLTTSILIAYALLGPAALADEAWRQGSAQGIDEAWVGLGPGNQILITCEDDKSESTGMSLTLAGSPPPSSSTVVFVFEDLTTFDIGVDDQGLVTSACHACGDSFDYLLGLLKSHSAVYVRFADKRGARFSLKGAKAAIGDCRSDWAQSAGG